MAVDSFLAFKRLMVKRNNELNRQAIEMFEKLQQKNTQSANPTPADGEPKAASATPAE